MSQHICWAETKLASCLKFRHLKLSLLKWIRDSDFDYTFHVKIAHNDLSMLYTWSIDQRAEDTYHQTINSSNNHSDRSINQRKCTLIRRFCKLILITWSIDQPIDQSINQVINRVIDQFSSHFSFSPIFNKILGLCVLSRPFQRISIVLFSVCLIQLCNLWHKWIIWIWIREQRANR